MTLGICLWQIVQRQYSLFYESFIENQEFQNFIFCKIINFAKMKFWNFENFLNFLFLKKYTKCLLLGAKCSESFIEISKFAKIAKTAKIAIFCKFCKNRQNRKSEKLGSIKRQNCLVETWANVLSLWIREADLMGPALKGRALWLLYIKPVLHKSVFSKGLFRHSNRIFSKLFKNFHFWKNFNFFNF